MTFAYPAWLFLLLLLPIMAVGAIVIARLHRAKWSVLMAERLRSALLKRSSPIPRWLAFAFLIIACAAMVVALARPRSEAGTRTEKTIGRNLLIALDLSRSMRVKDVQPDRLSQAKLVIFEMLEAMPQERIGLIGFAGDAYLYAPLTIDHKAVQETVEQIDENWVPIGGSNLASAIDLAIKTLKETGQKNNALVIISDGEKHEGDLEQMIAEAEQSGIYILAIGVGTEDGDYIPHADFPGNRMVDRDGKPVISRLQSEVMKKLANDTNGRYATAGTGADIPIMIKSAIADLDSFELEGRERKVFVEFYQWLLLPAILLLMASILANTRWRGVAPALVLACLFLNSNQAHADSALMAKLALNNGNHEKAQQLYHNLAESTPTPNRQARYRLGEATAAYRASDFRAARKSYSQSILSDETPVLGLGHLGMGNTLFQLGWQSLAGESYPADATKSLDLTDFDTIVRSRLKTLKLGPAEGGKASFSYSRFKSIITNWTDAVRHYDSSLAAEKSKAAEHNGEMTLAYLNRLAELLKEDEQKTQDEMPLPQPEDGEKQEGSDPSKPPEKEGDEGNKPDSQSGEGGEKDPNQKNQGEKDPNQRPQEKPNEDDGDSKPEPADPNESAEEQARRLLKENSDLEKGPITPGQRRFRSPEKDW